MEQTKLKRFKRILMMIIFALVLCTGTFAHILGKCSSYSNIEKVDTVSQIALNRVSTRDSIENALIDEVTEYLKKQSPKAHKFIPKYLVQAGLQHNIDICFMMAQTQIETNFGTTGIGKEHKKRSLFGVSARKYTNYKEAINDYCKILTKGYLVNGRTEQHLMEKYVNCKGARYAKHPTYEIELSKTYKNILAKTNIQTLQSEYNNYN